jgi:hypothetical protein
MKHARSERSPNANSQSAGAAEMEAPRSHIGAGLLKWADARIVKLGNSAHSRVAPLCIEFLGNLTMHFTFGHVSLFMQLLQILMELHRPSTVE